jgi:hypothetical protein
VSLQIQTVIEVVCQKIRQTHCCSDAFNGYCAARWQANTLNDNEQQEPLKSSILAKAHQQFYNTSTDSITLLTAKFSSGYRPAIGLKNKRNSVLWRFFDKEDECVMSHIFHTPEMQRACERSNNDGHLLGVACHEGQYYYESDRMLLTSPVWAEITRKKAGFVFNISFESINGSQLAHVKSELRILRLNINKTGRLASKHFKDESNCLQRINQFMHREVLNTLDNTSGVVTMQDTTEFALNCWLGVKEEATLAA